MEMRRGRKEGIWLRRGPSPEAIRLDFPRPVLENLQGSGGARGGAVFLLNSWDNLRERLDGLFPSGSLRARFARGTFWAVAGVVLAQLLALAASIVVAQIYNSRPLYGELGLIRNTVIMLGVVAGMGLGLTANRHVAEFRDTDPARAGRIVAMSWAVAVVSAALMAVLVLAFAPWLAAWVKTPHLAGALRIGALILFLEAINSVQLSTLAGFEAFKTSALLGFLRGVATFPLMTLGAWLGKSQGGDDGALAGVLWGLAAAAAFGVIANRIMLLRLMRRRGVPKASFAEARREVRLLWTTSLPVFLSSVLFVVAPWAASVLLVRVAAGDGGYAVFGLFTAANQWQYPVTLLAAQVAAVLLPMLASFPTTVAGRRHSDRAVEAAHYVVIISVLPLAAALSFLAGPIMSFYGQKFSGAEGAAWVFWAAVFVAGVKSLGTIPGTILLARGRMWSSLVINVVWAAVLVALVALRGHDAGSYADAFSTAYLAGAVLGLAWCGALRLCSWTLVASTALMIACLGGVTYGMSLSTSVGVRLGLVAGACIVAGLAALKGWRVLKEGVPAPREPAA